MDFEISVPIFKLANPYITELHSTAGLCKAAHARVRARTRDPDAWQSPLPPLGTALLFQISITCPMQPSSFLQLSHGTPLHLPIGGLGVVELDVWRVQPHPKLVRVARRGPRRLSCGLGNRAELALRVGDERLGVLEVTHGRVNDIEDRAAVLAVLPVGVGGTAADGAIVAVDGLGPVALQQARSSACKQQQESTAGSAHAQRLWLLVLLTVHIQCNCAL